jgi:CubicO group peptidase (beta-lactamase class C family)
VEERDVAQGTDLTEVLSRVEDWPVDTVGIGVTSADGSLGSYGALDEVLPFASLTKPLTAYAVLIAVQDGFVHLDEPAGPDEAPDAITVRHLLAHASGLPLEAGEGPIGAVGRRRIYSNWGYEILGDLVADRVGMPFAEHLDHDVLTPLGMDSTVLDGSPGHAARGTVHDLLAFARELLEPRLLDDELYREATTTVFPGLDGVVPGFGRQSPCAWGLGLEIKDVKDPHWTGGQLDPATFGHFGRSGSYLWVDPTRSVACAELADRDFGDWSKEHWPGLNDAIVDTVDTAAGNGSGS